MVLFKPRSFKLLILEVDLFVVGSSLEQFFKQRLVPKTCVFPTGRRWAGEAEAGWIPLTSVREE